MLRETTFKEKTESSSEKNQETSNRALANSKPKTQFRPILCPKTAKALSTELCEKCSEKMVLTSKTFGRTVTTTICLYGYEEELQTNE